MSKHAQKGVICLECHQAASGQEKKGHHGFVISAGHLTASTFPNLVALGFLALWRLSLIQRR